MKILFYGESPLHATGFGHVNLHLCNVLSAEDELTCVATGDTRSASGAYTIVGCPDENEPRNVATIEKYIKEMEWDLFFHQGDFGANVDVLLMAYRVWQEHPERNIVLYMPLDCTRVLPEAFDVLKLATVPVVYTYFAKDIISKLAPEVGAQLSVMWLGCDTQDFYPLSYEQKRAARLEIFGEGMLDRFLVLNVNRNQHRKDLARCMAAFHLFHEQYPESTLYLHSVMLDHGGWLPGQASLVGCDVHAQPAEITFSALDLATAWTRQEMNKLYNAVDVLVSTSYGEGWGLTTTEAMCAGTPVLVPRNTANLDIIGDGERGTFIKTGGDLDHTTFTYGGTSGGSPSDFIHADSFVKELAWMYTHRQEAIEKAQVARAWALANSWQHRENEWKQLLQAIKSRQLQTTMP